MESDSGSGGKEEGADRLGVTESRRSVRGEHELKSWDGTYHGGNGHGRDGP